MPGNATVFLFGGQMPPCFRWVASRRGSASCGPKRFEFSWLSTGGATARSPLTAEPSCKDEARVGQKNKITRRWAKRGTRPSAPHDQRTASAYIFGAICPANGKGAGLVLPSCNSEAMALHLEEISLAVAPDAHALVLLDQAGWHVSKKLPIPDNITLLPLPPKSPELNPVENIWQFMRDKYVPAVYRLAMMYKDSFGTTNNIKQYRNLLNIAVCRGHLLAKQDLA